MTPGPRSINGYHIYELDGIRYPSVTTILSRTEDPESKRGIENWRRNFSMPGFSSPDDYVNYTSIRGTIVHYNVLNSVVRELTGIELDRSDLPACSEWVDRKEMIAKDVAVCRKLFDDIGFDIQFPVSAESASYHIDKRYAGTKDLYAKIDGVKSILDLKTSSGLRDKHIVQVGAYVQTENHRLPGCVEQGILVYLHPKMKKALVKVIEGPELELAIDEFNERLEQFYRLPGVKREYGL
jgi:hypothetical protein